MKQTISRYILLLIFISALWFWGVPILFSKALPVVCENISHNTNYDIKIEKPRLKVNITPVVKILVDKITITSKIDKKNSLEIKNGNIKIRLLPILSGKLHINKIEAESIDIDSFLNKNLEIDKDSIQSTDWHRIKCNNIDIKNLDICIKQSNSNNTIKYSAKDIRYKKNNRYIKLNLDSKLIINNEESSAKINLYLPKKEINNKSIVDIKFNKFNIEPLGNALKQHLPTDIVDIKGIIDINLENNKLYAQLEKVKLVNKDTAKSMIFPENLTIVSQYNLSRKALTIENLSVKSKNIDCSLQGYIENYLDKKLTNLDLNIQLNKSRAEAIVEMLPPLVSEDFDIYKIKHYKFFGNAIANIKIKGDIVEPNITGDIFINNGVLIKAIKGTNGATIKISLLGKSLSFDVFVPAYDNEKVWVKGLVDDIYHQKYSNMRIWSTENVDLELAEEKVVPLHEILNFIIGPVPIMDIKGKGNIDITVKGNRQEPHVWGTLNFNNVKTHFIDMPDLVLSNAKATLNFNDQNVYFKTIKGMINNSNVKIEGTCNLLGKFDFYVNSENTSLDYLYKAIQTSELVNDLKNILPKLTNINGNIAIDLNIFGELKDINLLKYKENFFTKGTIKLLEDSFTFEELNINRAKGIINFENDNAKMDVNAHIKNSSMQMNAEVKDENVDASIVLPYLNLADLVNNNDSFIKDFSNIFLNVSAKYKGKLKDIEFDKVNLVAKILGETPENKLKLSKGIISLKNGHVNINNLKGYIKQSNGTFYVDLDINDSFKTPLANGNISFKNLDLNLLNIFANYTFLPADARKLLSSINFDKGNVSFDCKVKNNKIYTSSGLGGISFTYIPKNMAIKILNGNLIIKNSDFKLNKINLLVDNIPILIDGNIDNALNKPNLDLYINSKPRQDFIDKYFNNEKIYPIKIKGDIVTSATIKGTKDNIDIKSIIKMAKDSSIYYLGATVGDVENSIQLILNAKIINNEKLNIKEFSYDKHINSQNGNQTALNMLKASGIVSILKDDLTFNNLYIKTNHPTDARIFNILFRKPNIKQGQFTSDLKLNGKLSDLNMLGNFHIFETNIPFLETTMKDIDFKFKDKTINLYSKGEILNNDVVVKATLKNKLKPPYVVEQAEIETKDLDLNYVINKIKLTQVENISALNTFDNFDISTLIINNIDIKADHISLRNIKAKNVKASASFNNKQDLNIKNFKFDIANGNLNGNFHYNTGNNNVKLELFAKNIDANDLSFAVFDLNNQIYGDLTGDIKLACNGSNFENCLKTLNGKTTFNVTNGKMPKLGSLEYLLKAGNLIKGGITGLSLNSVIDLITPLKTGNFSNIYGDINIKDGVAKNIEISTTGEDLNLFVIGTYNFSSAIADMVVLGYLSKNVSTLLGPVGNLSVNTLFNAIPGIDLTKNSDILNKINKIPGIELSSKIYRKFLAEINGDINGDKYVKSFRWIN